MDLEKLRKLCLSLPHATEDVQWGNDLLFRIAGKMFTVVDLSPPHSFAFKCTPEEFAELTQVPGIIPAPYMARHQWVKIDSQDALRFADIQRLVKTSYQLVYEKLPPKMRKELEGKKVTEPSKKAVKAKK